MASSAPEGVADEKFARNGGSLVAVVGAVVILGFLVGWAIDIDRVPLWVPALALFGAVILYASTIRPQVLVQDSELVLRNMFTTVHIPLATIEEIAVQQVLAVRAGERRFVCAGAGRSLRAVMKGSRMERARSEVPGLTGEVRTEVVRGMDYGDFIESRVRELIRQDRSRRGISSVFSPEADALRSRIRREWARPELAAGGAMLLFVVVGFLVG